MSLAGWLRTHGHSDAALTLLRRVVRDLPQGRGLAEVYAALGVILLEDLREPTAAYQYLLSALELGPGAEVEATVREALQAYRNATEKARGRAATSLLVTLPTG